MDDRKVTQGGRLTTLAFGSTDIGTTTIDDPESNFVIDLRPSRLQRTTVMKSVHTETTEYSESGEGDGAQK